MMNKSDLQVDAAEVAAEAVTNVNRSAATDTVCVLRYKGHPVCATRFSSEALAQGKRQAEDEPVDLLTELVNQLRREVDKSLDGPSSLVSAQGSNCEDETVTLIKNLFAERIALEFYRETLHFFREREAERQARKKHG